MKRLKILLLLLVVCHAHANPKLTSMFKKMDADQNQQVTEAEYRDFWRGNFDRRDKDGDGSLAADAYPAKVSTHIDTNGDGLFQQSEEEAFRMKHFNQMDKDKNRVLTLAEMTAPRSAGKKN